MNDNDIKLTSDDIGQIFRYFHQYGEALGDLNYKIGEFIYLSGGEGRCYFVFQPINAKQYDEFKDGFIIQCIPHLEQSSVIMERHIQISYVKMVLNNYFSLGLK